MKKIILLIAMFFAMNAQAITVVSHVSSVHSSSHPTSVHVTSTAGNKMTNTAKTLTPNPTKPTEVVKTQSAKPVQSSAGAPVASLNAPAKITGCQETKEVKVQPKCSK